MFITMCTYNYTGVLWYRTKSNQLGFFLFNVINSHNCNDHDLPSLPCGPSVHGFLELPAIKAANNQSGDTLRDIWGSSVFAHQTIFYKTWKEMKNPNCCGEKGEEKMCHPQTPTTLVAPKCTKLIKAETLWVLLLFRVAEEFARCVPAVSQQLLVSRIQWTRITDNGFVRRSRLEMPNMDQPHWIKCLVRYLQRSKKQILDFKVLMVIIVVALMSILTLIPRGPG